MNQRTLRSLGLTILTLVTSLAITARADDPGLLSTARQGAPKTNRTPKNFLLLPLEPAQYQYDDGSAEYAISFGNGAENFEALWFNQFDVQPGADVIVSVSIAWGTPGNITPASVLNGEPITACIWSDPNGDGDPSDAVLLSSVEDTIQEANTDTFITYTFLTPVRVSGTSFFIGNLTGAFGRPQQSIESLDQNTLARKSWFAAMSSGAPVDLVHLGNNDSRGIIDDFSNPGNWLIRANAAGRGALELTSTVSMRGEFGILLPGIECRSGRPVREYSIIFTFNNNL